MVRPMNLAKSVLLILAALVSSPAFAFPAVGDKVTYSLDDGAVSGSITLELSAYDAATGNFSKLTVITVGSTVSTTSTTLNRADLLSSDQVNSILTNCDLIGGQLEQVTVAAGTFQTCKVEQDDGGYMNLGAVAFGVVRGETVEEDGTRTLIELTSFVNGR